jgi:alpha-L-fucosidase 2
MKERPTVSNPHAVEYTKLPTQWAEGLPLGNGELGVMCWSDGRQLRFTLDCAGAWDLRYRRGVPDYGTLRYQRMREWVAAGDFEALDAAARSGGEPDRLCPTKVYLGRLDLAVDFASDSEMSLSLDDASVRGVLRSDNETHALHAYVCRQEELFCLRVHPWPAGAQLEFLPFYETSPGLAALGHPQLQVSHDGELTVAVQQILPSTFFALCWNAVGPDVFVALASADSARSASDQALARHPHRRRMEFVELFDDHAQAWHDFWSVSGVVLPEKESESLWYFGLYLLASCARRGSNPPGLQGLWAMDGRDPPWRGDYHADMNVQETFWSACPAGHLDLLDVWLDFAYDTLPRAEEFTQTVFGTRGAFQPCAFLPEFTVLFGGGWHPVAFAWSHTGWLAHLAWLRWRYSRDTNWLARRGYPIIRSAFLFYSDNVEEEADGRYHIPLSSSPEYDGPEPTAWCKDPNIDIALIRKCCDWVCGMEAALGTSELSGRAREIHEKLVPYHLVEFEHPASYVRNSAPQGKRVLGLWKDKPLDYSHRHPSHLMAIHPAMDLTIEGSEDEREISEASVDHYLSLGQYCWAGHTYVQMVSLAAIVGRGEMAHNFLSCYRDRWILPNGLHFNRELGRPGNSHFALTEGENLSEKAPFTINESCGIACGISDMLIQGWGDCLRVFSAVPACWRDLLFVDLLTEGAFRVSGLMREGQVRWVRITAGADGPCRLRNPFREDDDFQVCGCTPERHGDALEWAMTAGQTVTLFLSGYEEPDLQEEANRIRAPR